MSRSRHARGGWKAKTRWSAPTDASDSAVELIRFMGETIDPDSGEREGLFQVAVPVHREGSLAPEDAALLQEKLDWLTANLDSPRQLSPFHNALRRGRAGASRRTSIAVSWFKSTAVDHIACARALAEVLSRAGFPVEEIRTTRPGYVTHEDEFQVVAVPFR